MTRIKPRRRLRGREAEAARELAEWLNGLGPDDGLFRTKSRFVVISNAETRRCWLKYYGRLIEEDGAERKG